MARVVTLGELLLRLSPPGNSRIVQASSFDIHYGGAEANVACSLSHLGHDTSFVSKVPLTTLGDAAISSLMKNGVNCSNILRGGDRLGLYFVEKGASIRPSSVIYDRENSSIANCKVNEFDFDKIFEGADLFHITGITAVLSSTAAEITLSALKHAKSKGITVSFDLNYRAKLWVDSIIEKQELLSHMIQYVDICFGNARDAAKCLGYNKDDIDFINGDFTICVEEKYMRDVLQTYNLKYLIAPLRNSISASHNTLSGIVYGNNSLYKGKEYNLDIVDRVGGGDSFAAGFLHGILLNMDMKKSLEFAIAASSLKHTIPGDTNYVSEEEVVNLINSCGFQISR